MRRSCKGASTSRTDRFEQEANAMTAPVITRVKVQDYEKWRPIFDSHAGTRKDAGCMSTQVLRNVRDNTEVLISFQWDTQANAQKYLDSAGLAKTVQTAGVVTGDIWYLQEAGG